MRFSKRTDWPSVPNALAAALAAKKKAGARVIDLTLSNPTRAGFRYLKRALLKPLADPAALAYDPDPRGLESAREAVCRYYAAKGAAVDPSQVFLTASTSEAYAFTLRLLADPGDSILVPSPSYPLFDFLAALNDVTPVPYPIVYSGDGWRADTEALEAAFADAVKPPRAAFVVHPNNPTGHLVDAPEREALQRAASAAGAAVVSDEVFLDFAYEKGRDRETFVTGGPALTFTLSGISKALGLPQMKLSWIVVSGPLVLREKAAERLETIADTYLSVGTPAQLSLPAWLDRREGGWHEILRRVTDNRAFLLRTFKKHPKARVLRADGGWYAVVRFESARRDEELALELLEKRDVHVHPGYFFDFKTDEHLVLSLLPPPADFREGVARLAAALAP